MGRLSDIFLNHDNGDRVSRTVVSHLHFLDNTILVLDGVLKVIESVLNGCRGKGKRYFSCLSHRFLRLELWDGFQTGEILPKFLNIFGALPILRRAGQGAALRFGCEIAERGNI